MRDVTRLIALAIIAFTITALAVTLDNPTVSDALARRFGLGGGTDDQRARMAESETIVRVGRPHPSAWLGLQGFPSQTIIRFPIPHDAGLIDGQVQLDLQSELIEQGDGLLRIVINGIERDAIVLERGTHSHRLTYDLTPSDLAAGAIVVTLSGNGTTNYGQICPTNVTNLGAAIEVLPSSALLLGLDKLPSGPASLAVLLPEPLNLGISAVPGPSAWATQWLSRQGVPAVLTAGSGENVITVAAEGSEAMSVSSGGALSLAGEKGVQELGKLRGAALPASYGRQWPLPVDALTTDLLTHTFRGSSRWSLKYKLADLPDGRAPGGVSLSLRTSRLQQGNHWTVRVLLNGSLIHSENYPGDSDTISLTLSLPAELQGLSNELAITLIDNTPNQGICRAGPEAAAQLLPASRLDASSSPVNNKQALVNELARGGRVSIGDVEGLAAAEYLAGMLDLILPLNTEVVFGPADGVPAVQVLNGEKVRSAPAGMPLAVPRNAFLVMPSSRARPDGIEVVRLAEAGDVLEVLDAASNVLLVTW